MPAARGAGAARCQGRRSGARPARAPAEAGGTAMMWRRLAKWYHVREGYWFAPKLFGYGATPVTWQGWLLSFGLMLLLIAAIRFIPSDPARFTVRSEEHTSELQSLMRISYAVFCLKKKNKYNNLTQIQSNTQQNITT